MPAPARWTTTAVFCWCALLLWHGFGAVRFGGDSSVVFRVVYGFGYFIFGAVVLGVIARRWPQMGAPLWRPLMLASTAGLALLQVWLVHVSRAVPLSLDTWMAALLGIAIAAIAPRLFPSAWVRYWLAMERSTRGK
jgi:hypothetical protein